MNENSKEYARVTVSLRMNGCSWSECREALKEEMARLDSMAEKDDDSDGLILDEAATITDRDRDLPEMESIISDARTKPNFERADDEENSDQ